MPRLSIRLSHFRGIPIRIHLTFVLLLAFLFWRTGTSIGIQVALLQSLLVVLLFACVALHELGHATVAITRGIPISEITLYPYGGVARLARRPPDGITELQIAVAGPAVNLVLAALLLLLTGGGVLHPGQNTWLRLIAFLFWANLIIAVFNLLPAFPLDGGRVLRGALASKMGWIRATIWSASAGQVVAVLLMVAGSLHDPWLLLGGLLLFPGANAELRLALELRTLARSRVHEVMLPEIQLVGPDASLRALTDVSRDAPMTEFVVHDGIDPVGYLPAGRLWSALRSTPPGPQTAADAALPIAAPVAVDAPLNKALEWLDRARCDAAPVMDDTGTIVGVITRSAIERTRAISRHLKNKGMGD